MPLLHRYFQINYLNIKTETAKRGMESARMGVCRGDIFWPARITSNRTSQWMWPCHWVWQDCRWFYTKIICNHLAKGPCHVTSIYVVPIGLVLIKDKITLLRLIPTMTCQDIYLDIYLAYSDILSEIYSGKCSGILICIYLDIPPGILSDILSGIISEIVSDI